MDLDKLYRILRETTVPLRKSEEVVEHQSGNVKVTEIFDMPHESQAKNSVEKVDCHFIVVGVDKVKAEGYREELTAILETYPQPERLAGELSYIEMGGVFGDQGQEVAFQLFAVGQVLGFWQVLTPEVMGITGPTARQMAGAGMVTISGFKTT